MEMGFGSHNSGDDVEYNGVGLVEISGARKVECGSLDSG